MAEKVIFSVCQRVWVKEFYLQNAGFFVVSGLFLVVFLGGDSLQVLSAMAVKSPGVMFAGFVAPSLLYAWKCLSWSGRQIRMEGNSFLGHLILFPEKEQLNILIRMMAGMLMPLYPFCFLLLSKALFFMEVPAILMLAGLLPALHAVPAFWLKQQLKKPFDANAGNRTSTFLHLKAGPFSWLLNQLIGDAAMMLFWTKLLSTGLVAGSLILYHSDSYDHRLPSLALTASAFLHLGLLDELSKLESKLQVVKNLPFSVFKRVGINAGMLLPLLLPELLIFLRNCPEETGWLYRLSASFFYAGLVVLNSQMRLLFWLFPNLREKMLPALFFFVSLSIMYKIPVFLPAILFLMTAILLNQYLYYKTETHSDEKKN